MNIEERLEKIGERLDRLTERHEALSERLELLTREGAELLELAKSRERRNDR
jgi:hypothetical protein